MKFSLEDLITMYPNNNSPLKNEGLQDLRVKGYFQRGNSAKVSEGEAETLFFGDYLRTFKVNGKSLLDIMREKLVVEEMPANIDLQVVLSSMTTFQEALNANDEFKAKVLQEFQKFLSDSFSHQQYSNVEINKNRENISKLIQNAHSQSPIIIVNNTVIGSQDQQMRESSQLSFTEITGKQADINLSYNELQGYLELTITIPKVGIKDSEREIVGYVPGPLIARFELIPKDGVFGYRFIEFETENPLFIKLFQDQEIKEEDLRESLMNYLEQEARSFLNKISVQLYSVRNNKAEMQNLSWLSKLNENMAQTPHLAFALTNSLINDQEHWEELVNKGFVTRTTLQGIQIFARLSEDAVQKKPASSKKTSSFFEELFKKSSKDTQSDSNSERRTKTTGKNPT